MHTFSQVINNLQNKLSRINELSGGKKVFVGFDGFIDSIKRPIKERHPAATEYFNLVDEFLNRMQESKDKSCHVEMETQHVKLGGSAPLIANALGRFGIRNYCAGALGSPCVHAEFESISDNCEIYSAANAALNDAIEFDNGKLIFSDLRVFDDYTWQYLKKTIGIAKMRNCVSECSMIALVNWASLPHATDIWEGLLEEVIRPMGKKDFMFLFDLGDPSNKTAEEIDQVLDLISCFSCYGKVTLSLNENETLKIWAALNGIVFHGASGKQGLPKVEEAADSLYKSMNINTLLLHTRFQFILFHAKQKLQLDRRIGGRPKVLTGGGDNMNAGYCFGLLNRLTLTESMLLGVATAGAYFKKGLSLSLADVINYLHEWTDEMTVKSTQMKEEVFSGPQGKN